MLDNDKDISEVIEEICLKALPELSPGVDVRKIPCTYSPEEFRKKLSELDSRDIFILASYILDMKNELMSGVVNVFLSEIAERIKNAKAIYGVQSCCLAKQYPFFAGENDTYTFLNKDEGERFVKELSEKTGEKLALKEFDKVTEYFLSLSRYGVEYIRIEPGLCRLRYKQDQVIENSFDSISGGELNRAVLRLLQAQERKAPFGERLKLEKKMLDAVRKGSFACKGVTINGSFEAVLITDVTDKGKWIPIFTDTAEIQDTFETIPGIAKLFVTSETVTVSFSELRRYMDLDKVSGVVINIGGYGIRLTKEKCKLIIDLGKIIGK